MTLKECYTLLEGDYTEVMDRLKKEEMVTHFLKLFAAEDFFTKLKAAIAAGDMQAAFRIVHSLKGNCMSLGFTQLQKIAETMTGPLRDNQLDEVVSLLTPLEKEYGRTVTIIGQLDG